MKRIVTGALRILIVGAFAAGTLACGEPKPAATATVASPQSTGKPEPQPEPPLKPVAAPPDVVFVARLSKPAKALDLISQWVTSPVNWRSLLSQEAGDWEKVIDTNGPVDAVVALSEDPAAESPVVFALSIPLVDRDVAADYLRKRGKTVARAGSHAYEVSGAEPCVIVRALGVAKARLICSDSQGGLEALSPYMARGLPMETLSDSTVFADLHLGPVRKRYGKQAAAIKLGVPFILQETRTGDSRLDAAVAQAVRGLADEAVALTEDLERVQVEGFVREAEQQVDLRMSTQFRGTKSWSARWLSELAASQTPAPDSFWQLPVDSSGASYSIAGNPESWVDPAAVLSEIAEAWLQHAGADRRKVSGFGQAFRDAFLTPGPVVLAKGAVPKLEPKASAPPDPALEIRKALGFYLVGITGDQGRQLKLLEQAITLYGDKSLRDFAKKELQWDLALLPTITKRTVPAARDLAPGAVQFTATFPKSSTATPGKDKDADTKPLALPPAYLIVMPLEKETWFGASMDEAELLRRMVEVKRHKERTLVERTGLESLRSQVAVSAGFGSLASYFDQGSWILATALEDTDKAMDLTAVRELADGSLPHRGMVPVISRFSATVQGPTFTHEMSVSKGTFEDLAMLVAAFAAAAR